MNVSIDLPGPSCLAALHPEIELDQKWIDAEEFELLGLRLDVRDILQAADRKTLRLVLENRSGKTYRLGGIRLRQEGVHGDFLEANGEDFRLYLEGWSMPTPCGMKRLGDCDFSFDPGYLKNAVAEPREYEADTPNHFRAEHAIGISNVASGRTILIGFVTGADQFGRFTAALDAQGVSELAITAGLDDRLFERGDIVETEEIAFFAGTDINALLSTYADLWAERMHARVPAKVPVGWCSWYYYFSKVTEQDMFENVEYLAAHRDEYPLDIIQLDDGYQPACGDWLDPQEKFPHGVQAWALRARELGFTAGLWLAPFFIEKTSRVFQEHPEWCIHDREGNIPTVMKWRGVDTAALDGTHPGAQQFLRDLFANIRALGFDYVKLDFLVFSSVVRDGVLYDQKATRAQALRRAMEVIREGFGDDGFILGCTSPFGPLVGIVDAMRVATDITPHWAKKIPYFDEAPVVPNVCRNDIQHAYMNHRLWINDPDTHIARTDNNELTESEVRLWTAALKIVGGALLLSDRFETLIPERAALSKMLLSDPDAYEALPLDRLERTIPAVWYAKRRDGKGAILGLFNVTNEPQAIPVDLPLEGKKLRELFSHRDVEELPALVEPHSVFAVEILD
ncbi:MAG: alpha-galactosidase [Victivallales bacterium]|nr:alpha-galactosidase [Victivallales bacterium]